MSKRTTKACVWSKEDVIEGLYDGCYDYFNSDYVYVCPERSICADLVSLERLVKEVVSCGQVLFNVNTKGWNSYLVYDALGREVMRFIWREEWIRHHYPLHRFSPHVEAFFSCSNEFRQKYYDPGVSGYLSEEVCGVAESLNKMIEALKGVVSSDFFKAEINQHTRSSNKNRRSIVKYINALFDSRSRLLVVRVDLGYETRVKRNGGDISYAQAKEHREEFFKEIKKLFPNGDLVGYCWKLEFGISKSYHYHVMVFLDGAKRREDISLGKLIGETWRDKVTLGKGVYFNCNSKKSAYRSCGIGMISHDEDEKRKNLLSAGAYLTKQDIYIKIAIEGSGRSFGRGEMPKLDLVKKGRPRKGKQKKSCMRNPGSLLFEPSP